ncbi:hypothetical protein Pd630_LPD12042 (plasmid) [Rhodococcus opacus PD630]|nr:hypothetical protein Pd630_LPD12042 [Rhodococcus opacus PD630]
MFSRHRGGCWSEMLRVLAGLVVSAFSEAVVPEELHSV